MNKLILIASIFICGVLYSQESPAIILNVKVLNAPQSIDTLTLNGTELGISLSMDGIGLQTVDLSGLGSGGSGTDDQTLAEVLSSGNVASSNIDMNGFLLSNVSSIFVNSSISGGEVRLEIDNTVGSTIDYHTLGFLTGNRHYLQKVNDTDKLIFDFSALTANRTVTFPDADVDIGALSGSGTDDQTAAEVPFTPNGSIAATDVQAAIQEVRDEASGITAEQAERIDNQGFYHTRSFAIDQEITASMAKPVASPYRGRRGKLIFTANSTATLTNVLPIDYSFIIVAGPAVDAVIIEASGIGVLYGEMNVMEYRSENIKAVSLDPGRSVIVTRTAADEYNVEGGANFYDPTPPVDPPIEYVNLSTYGVTGDGIADDTAELQAAFDSGNNLIANPGLNILLSAQVVIDQNGAQSIDLNGAILHHNISFVPYALRIQKPDRAVTTISNFTLDGENANLKLGIQVNSPIDATNVDVKNFYWDYETQGVGCVIAWGVNINSTQYGTYNWDGCDVTSMHSKSNGNLGDCPGSSRAYDFQWTNLPAQSLVTVENFVWDGFYGEDGGPLRIDDLTGQDASILGHKTIFRNGINKNFQRRGTKLAMDNVEFYNVEFSYIATSNPKYENSEPAGMIGARALGADPSGFLDNVIIEGCIFNNTGAYPWALIDGANNMQWRNCTFKAAAGIRIGNVPNSVIGDVTICGSTFEAGGKIKQQLETVSNAAGTQIIIDSDNIADVGYIEFTTMSFSEQAVTGCSTSGAQ